MTYRDGFNSGRNVNMLVINSGNPLAVARMVRDWVCGGQELLCQWELNISEWLKCLDVGGGGHLTHR